MLCHATAMRPDDPATMREPLTKPFSAAAESTRGADQVAPSLVERQSAISSPATVNRVKVTQSAPLAGSTAIHGSSKKTLKTDPEATRTGAFHAKKLPEK